MNGDNGPLHHTLTEVTVAVATHFALTILRRHTKDTHVVNGFNGGFDGGLVGSGVDAGLVRVASHGLLGGTKSEL